MKHSPTVSDPDADTQALLQRVGNTVRAARTARRMPRRSLSELSGVSARYLAQLEGGQGNISIALLQRVAAALDLRLIDLLQDPVAEQEASLLDLYRRADTSTQAAVVRRLEAAAEVPDKAHRICLIGLRGAGKSTLGRRAGDALNIPFIELNRDIELTAGMPVGEIMALYGSDGYRQMESEAVRRVAARHDKLILAVAGGIVSDRETYDTVLSRFHTVWVKASPEEHMARVRAQGDMRPMQGQAGAMDQLRSLLEDRGADYARADARVDTTGKTADQSHEELLALIALNGFLD
jgi:XRE family aerobic/anaerobic benzoate catabolism transcriptional regulator